MIKLNNILTEAKCDADIGKILFHKFAFYYPKNKDEPDTEYEKRVYDSIKSFIRGDFNNVSKDKDLVNVIKELLKCKDDIPLALKPRDVMLYRGSFAGMDMFQKYFTKNVKIFGLSKRPVYREANVKYKYNPNSLIQSWTTDLNVAKQFMTKQRNSKGFQNGFPIIYKLDKPNKEFIFNDRFLNLFHFDEDEVIRLGKSITVDSVIYYPDDIRKFMMLNNITK